MSVSFKLLTHQVYIIRHADAPEDYVPTQGERVFYTGRTEDFWQRLERHNKGDVKATRGHQWVPHVRVSGMIRSESVRLEMYLKVGNTTEKRHWLMMFCEIQGVTVLQWSRLPTWFRAQVVAWDLKERKRAQRGGQK